MRSMREISAKSAIRLLCPLTLAKRVLNKLEGKCFDRFYASAFRLVEEGSLVVRLAEFDGSFEIDARSHILARVFKTGRYESELAEIVKRYVDSSGDAIDVGANVGLFSVLLAKLLDAGRHVLAIEPTPPAIKHLRNNIRRNGVNSSVIVFEGVANDAGGLCVLSVIEGKEEYSSLGGIRHCRVRGEPSRKIEVPGSTIDELVEKHGLSPGFIKIDTEGAECLVIAGAKETIRRHRPVILSEASETLLAGCNCSSDELFALLRESQYRILDAYDPRSDATAPFNGDILAIPLERQADSAR